MNKPTFFTADTHFGHEAIRRHCHRPFETTEQMDQAIVDNWNGIVPCNGLVYVLGDFAWRDHRKYLARLNGSKILILGNHDAMSQLDLAQFAEVHQLLDRSFDKKQMTLCHYKMQTYRNSFHGAWHLFGHSHGRLCGGALSFDIGVDVWDYRPVPFEVVRKKMLAKAAMVRGKNFDGEAEEVIKREKEVNKQWSV